VFSSRFMPCVECGESVEGSQSDSHRCKPARLLDYQMFGLRGDIAGFEAMLLGYLLTTRGSFEVWLAARQVRTGHA
jgi:hypothetical protein